MTGGVCLPLMIARLMQTKMPPMFAAMLAATALLSAPLALQMCQTGPYGSRMESSREEGDGVHNKANET